MTIDDKIFRGSRTKNSENEIRENIHTGKKKILNTQAESFDRHLVLDLGVIFPAWLAVHELAACMDQLGAISFGAAGRSVGANARVVAPAELLRELFPAQRGASVVFAISLVLVPVRP